MLVDCSPVYGTVSCDTVADEFIPLLVPFLLLLALGFGDDNIISLATGPLRTRTTARMTTNEINSYIYGSAPISEEVYHLRRLGSDFTTNRRQIRLQRLLSRSP